MTAVVLSIVLAIVWEGQFQIYTRQNMQRMVQDGHRPDVVFLDPPRAGSDERFLRSLLKAAPDRVIYVSCDPETLARDLKVLTAGGYQVRRIQPVDMFPWTEHIENVVLLQKLNS